MIALYPIKAKEVNGHNVTLEINYADKSADVMIDGIKKSQIKITAHDTLEILFKRIEREYGL